MNWRELLLGLIIRICAFQIYSTDVSFWRKSRRILMGALWCVPFYLVGRGSIVGNPHVIHHFIKENTIYCHSERHMAYKSYTVHDGRRWW